MSLGASRVIISFIVKLSRPDPSHPCGRASPYVLGGVGNPQPPLKPPTLGGNGSGNVSESGGTRSPTLITRRKGLQTFFEGWGVGEYPRDEKSPERGVYGALGSGSEYLPLTLRQRRREAIAPPWQFGRLATAQGGAKGAETPRIASAVSGHPESLALHRQRAQRGGSERFARGLSPPRTPSPTGRLRQGGAGLNLCPSPRLWRPALGGVRGCACQAKKKAVRYCY